MTDNELFQALGVFVPREMHHSPDSFINHLRSLVRPPFGYNHTINLCNTCLTISNNTIDFLDREAHQPFFVSFTWSSLREFLIKQYPASFYEREVTNNQLTIDYDHPDTKQSILTQLNNAF